RAVPGRVADRARGAGPGGRGRPLAPALAPVVLRRPGRGPFPLPQDAHSRGRLARGPGEEGAGSGDEEVGVTGEENFGDSFVPGSRLRCRRAPRRGRASPVPRCVVATTRSPPALRPGGDDPGGRRTAPGKRVPARGDRGCTRPALPR